MKREEFYGMKLYSIKKWSSNSISSVPFDHEFAKKFREELNFLSRKLITKERNTFSTGRNSNLNNYYYLLIRVEYMYGL